MTGVLFPDARATNTTTLTVPLETVPVASGVTNTDFGFERCTTFWGLLAARVAQRAAQTKQCHVTVVKRPVERTLVVSPNGEGLLS